MPSEKGPTKTPITYTDNVAHDPIREKKKGQLERAEKGNARIRFPINGNA